MPIALLDTGVWFSYFVKNDTFHHDANLLVTELIAGQKKIVLPEAGRFELLNALTHELLNHEAVRQISQELHNLSPHVEIRYGSTNFWDTVLPANLPRLFLKSFDFIIAAYALHWEVTEFYSFDEKLNQALRRLKPEMVKVQVRKGRVIRSGKN